MNLLTHLVDTRTMHPEEDTVVTSTTKDTAEEEILIEVVTIVPTMNELITTPTKVANKTRT